MLNIEWNTIMELNNVMDRWGTVDTSLIIHISEFMIFIGKSLWLPMWREILQTLYSR